MSTEQPGSSAPEPLDSLTCQQITDAIIDYLTGAMRPESARRFADHLRRCPDCVAFLNTYESTVRATRSLSYEDVPDEMRARVRQFLLTAIARK